MACRCASRRSVPNRSSVLIIALQMRRAESAIAMGLPDEPVRFCCVRTSTSVDGGSGPPASDWNEPWSRRSAREGEHDAYESDDGYRNAGSSL